MKITAFLLFTLWFISCKNNDNKTTVNTQQDTINNQVVNTPDSVKADGNFEGTYSGSLPCEYCKDKGLLTKLTILKDSAYSLSSQELGNEATPRIFKGVYSFKKSDSIITLDAEGDHLKFKIMDGKVKKLDKFGDNEQGGPAARYLLHKVQ